MTPGGGGGTPPSLDLTKAKEKGTSAEFSPVDGNSLAWAKIARPFAWVIFILAALTIVIPFIVIWSLPGAGVEERFKTLLDWGKTVLAPVVGFGSAVTGYFFGTRSNNSSPKPQPGDLDDD